MDKTYYIVAGVIIIVFGAIRLFLGYNRKNRLRRYAATVKKEDSKTVASVKEFIQKLGKYILENELFNDSNRMDKLSMEWMPINMGTKPFYFTTAQRIIDEMWGLLKDASRMYHVIFKARNLLSVHYDINFEPQSRKELQESMRSLASNCADWKYLCKIIDELEKGGTS